jgi:hypothetical protein
MTILPNEMAVAGRSQHDRSVTAQSLLFITPSERPRRILEKHHNQNKNNIINNSSGKDSGSSLFSNHFPPQLGGFGHFTNGGIDGGDMSRYYIYPYPSRGDEESGQEIPKIDCESSKIPPFGL